VVPNPRRVVGSTVYDERGKVTDAGSLKRGRKGGKKKTSHCCALRVKNSPKERKDGAAQYTTGLSMLRL